ncbi:hypothetical protein AAZX31_02G077300 [Glycine max]
MRIHRQGKHPHSMNQHQAHPCQGSSVHDGFPHTMGTFQNCEHQTLNKNSPSDESFVEEGIDGHYEVGKGKKGLSWQRVKWTDKMVKLLITVVSYIGEDATFDNGCGRGKFTVLQKNGKGKWKYVSKDKFNDLNKRYKKLNDMLGRGTSCQVVQNPSLLDLIDYLSEKEKYDVQKILSSRHLFYKEIDDHDNDGIRKSHHGDHDKDVLDVEIDDHDDSEENYTSPANSKGYRATGQPFKSLKLGQGQEDAATFGSALNNKEYNKSSHPHMVQSDGNQALHEKNESLVTKAMG